MIDNPMDTHWILTCGFDDGWFFLSDWSRSTDINWSREKICWNTMKSCFLPVHQTRRVWILNESYSQVSGILLFFNHAPRVSRGCEILWLNQNNPLTIPQSSNWPFLKTNRPLLHSGKFTYHVDSISQERRRMLHPILLVNQMYVFLHRFLAPPPHRRASSNGYSQPAPFLMKPQKAEKPTPGSTNP